MQQDPVCGKWIPEQTAGQAEYEGKIYFFCSEDCRLEFEDDPDRFVGWEGESRAEGFA